MFRVLYRMKKNLFNLFLENVNKFPEKIAYKFQDTALTYQQTATLSFIMGQNLKNKGAKKGTHVGVIASNSLEFALLYWSAAYLGAVLVPLMAAYTDETIKHLSEATDVELIVIEKKNLSRKKQLLEHFEIFPMPELRDLTSKKDALSIKDSQADPHAPYIITMTSGSTSLPKPIVLSQESKIRRSINGAKEIYGLSEIDVVITSTPMDHSVGMRMVILPLLLGGTGVILSTFSPSLWIKTVQREGVTFAMIVSNQVESILDLLEKEDLHLKSLKKLLSSSYTLKVETKERFLKRAECRFYECYGASEVGIATNVEFHDNSSKLGSVGRPLPYCDIKILDENDKPLPFSEKGEIAVKSITKFSGYYREGKKTSESFWNEYFKTGDIGYLDEEGFLYFLSRKKNVIKYGALNLYPRDIEEVVMRFRGIKECAVIGVEDKYLGEVPLAVIVADEKIEKKEIRKFCLKNLSDYQVPVDFVFVDEIPKNELGKVQNFKLRDSFSKYRGI